MKGLDFTTKSWRMGKNFWTCSNPIDLEQWEGMFKLLRCCWASSWWKKNTCKRWPSYMAYSLGLVSEVPTIYQEIMNVTKCMEDDSVHNIAGMPLISHLTTRVSIKSATQATSGPKRGQKRKWDKSMCKDKGTLAEKKLRDVAKVQCFNCDELGHFAKDYENVSQDWA